MTFQRGIGLAGLAIFVAVPLIAWYEYRIDGREYSSDYMIQMALIMSGPFIYLLVWSLNMIKCGKR